MVCSTLLGAYAHSRAGTLTRGFVSTHTQAVFRTCTDAKARAHVFCYVRMGNGGRSVGDLPELVMILLLDLCFNIGQAVSITTVLPCEIILNSQCVCACVWMGCGLGVGVGWRPFFRENHSGFTACVCECSCGWVGQGQASRSQRGLRLKCWTDCIYSQTLTLIYIHMHTHTTLHVCSTLTQYLMSDRTPRIDVRREVTYKPERCRLNVGS